MGADILHKIDNTARLNIWLDNKNLGQIKPSEYVIIKLEEGIHSFKVLHLDIFRITSEHNIKVDNETKIIKIKPTLYSNNLQITDELPKRFHKFKYADKR